MVSEFWKAFREGFVQTLSLFVQIPLWALAWTAFYAGDAVSRIFLRYDATAFMYPAYNRLMCWSADLQDLADLPGPWEYVVRDAKGDDDGQ